MAELSPRSITRVGLWLFALPMAVLAAEIVPSEVAQYIERRKLCEHFRGEPWSEGSSVADKERREFLARQFKRYCKGSDAGLRELKRKYKNNRSVIERLDEYEPDIEGR